MTTNNNTRIDEVARFYRPVEIVGKISVWLFWTIAIVSLFIPYLSDSSIPLVTTMIQPIFICLVLLHFGLSQYSRFHLVPKAERKRRQQLLSDSFGTSLSHDRTEHYYNNEYEPTMIRLGASTMENAFFSKAIASKMLPSKRIITGMYLIVWVLIFALPTAEPETLMWITQLVFSTEIIVQWLTLEQLRRTYKGTYDELHSLFLNKTRSSSSESIATIIDSFTSYEAAKHSAGFLLSSKIFFEMNQELSEKWDQIRKDLNMK